MGLKMKTLEEKNALVAEFMGLKKYPDYVEPYYYINYGQSNQYCTKLKFHESMDWLYPVWQKLTETELPTIKHTSHFGATYHKRVGDSIGVLLSQAAPVSDIFESIVEAIEWYNKNKK